MCLSVLTCKHCVLSFVCVFLLVSLEYVGCFQGICLSPECLSCVFEGTVVPLGVFLCDLSVFGCFLAFLLVLSGFRVSDMLLGSRVVLRLDFSVLDISESFFA